MVQTFLQVRHRLAKHRCGLVGTIKLERRWENRMTKLIPPVQRGA
jgi:hypothetical protein